MSEKPDAVLIGAFVTGAIVLLVGGLIFFGSGLLFSERETFVLYFDSSLKGLDVGSPVTFRGVPIGQVKKIKILMDPQTGSFKMPVYISINPESLFSYSGSGGVSELTNRTMKDIISKRGLRAQLQIQSLVTGKLQVDLDFHPEAPARYVGLDKKHVEIPTVPSTVENIVRRFQEIPVDKLVGKLISTIDGIERLVQSGKVSKTLDALYGSIQELRVDMKTVMPALMDTLKSIKGTSSATRTFIGNTDRTLARISGELDRLAASASDLVENVNQVLSQVDTMTAPDSPERYELRRMLSEVSRAARSLRILADSISAQPDILLKGRYREKEDGK